MVRNHQLGTVLLAIMVTAAAALLIVGAGGVFAQDEIEWEITDIQADAPGNDRENLNGESVTLQWGDIPDDFDNASEINISGYTLEYGDGEVYELEPSTASGAESGSIIQGTKIIVATGGGENFIEDSLPPIYRLHANFDQPVLNNSGDTVTLRNAEGEVVAQRSYGSAGTPPGSPTMTTTTTEGPTSPTMTTTTETTTSAPTDTTTTDGETTTETTTTEDDGATTATEDGDDGTTEDGEDGKAKQPEDGDAGDGGDGKAKQDGGADDGGEGKAKQGDDGGSGDGADGGNGKAKLN